MDYIAQIKSPGTVLYIRPKFMNHLCYYPLEERAQILKHVNPSSLGKVI